MENIEVVSAGPGRAGMMTAEAARAMREADAVFCAARHRLLVPDGVRARALFPFAPALEEIAALRAAGGRAAVLLSGDAGIYSLLGKLKTRFGADALRVHPGVSALQAFCAAMGRGWQNARVLSAHGRDLSAGALCHAARTNGEVILFLGGEHDPAWVRRTLDAGGLARVRMTVGERISYEDERIGPYEARAYDPLCMALLDNDAPEAGLPPVGLPDEAFIRGKTPMTKREVRTLAVTSLCLPMDAVIWDVGAGTGSVSVECARQCPLGTVYAVERDDEALGLIARNKEKFGAVNLTVVPGSAPRALRDLPVPTHVFLGGTGGACGEIFDLLRGMNARVRIAATAVTMESAQALLEHMRPLEDFSAAQVGVSRLCGVGEYTMIKAQNPVFLLSGTMRGAEAEG
ncbi:MAG: precorrin-6y C5,15-methyltransferase (decarboxylating) subunit CbiE [Clostridia bacterium]|nr:precorrin-6y C5,15-methyltransferase (decarboxylating) subunit CbiE [Clostridia bacterium]